MTAYYNEHDKFAAQWLRNLISAGLIADGEVDERDIRDVTPAELSAFTQCHFFAGIGVWSYALRQAGWPDDKPVWTGSCPCQPFSAAGRGEGFVDERHLWPHWFHLIGQCRPGVVLGEQVASRDGLAWLDLVHADMEGADYAIGALDICAAGFGSPNIRQRQFWVADTNRRKRDGIASGQGCQCDRTPTRREQGHCEPQCGCKTGELADAAGGRRREQRCEMGPGDVRHIDGGGRTSGGVVDANGGDASAEGLQRIGVDGQRQTDSGPGGSGPKGCRRDVDRGLEPGPTNGFWRNTDWLFCQDGRWRPVESGTFPLATGATARVGRLRGYGNGLNGEVATGFIKAYIEVNETEYQ